MGTATEQTQEQILLQLKNKDNTLRNLSPNKGQLIPFYK